MLKTGYKSILLLVSVFLLVTCIDPYNPKLGEYTSIMVVDGLITNSNNSYIIHLSQTFQDQNSNLSKVSDATVYISDDNGNIINLVNKGSGVYKTDSTQFNGIPGRTYVLHISTNDGRVYESDPCEMYPVPEIDSVYFAKDQQLSNNGTESLDGISIYLDSHDAANNQYLRWSYDETWKYKVPYPKKYNYIKGTDPDTPGIIPVSNVKEFCWNNKPSDEILIRSINNGQTEKIKKQPIFFIAPEKSSRLLSQYTVLVKQYSISKNEYDFWDNLKQINETGNDIFARQPYSVLSNLHSNTDPKERVLGFFQVSAVSQQRMNIIYNEVGYIGLHFYTSDCSVMSLDPTFYYTQCNCPPPTWDDVYRKMSAAGYAFTEPIFDISGKALLKLVFSKPECIDCEISGSSNEPYFWKDINW